MNRQIKFRAIAKVKKAQTHYFTLEELMRHTTNFAFPEHWYFNQFTGFQDKNGKEIYEGDIVRMKQNAWGYVEHLLVIEYDSENFSVKAKCIDLNGDSHATVKVGDSYALSVLHRYKDLVEIIGNIYENKELLK